MGKALMVQSFPGHGSGVHGNIFGSDAAGNATAANSTVEAVEGVSFSKLGFFVLSGNAGETAKIEFYKNGAAATQTITISGDSSAGSEDATNTDTLAATDKFSTRYTKTVEPNCIDAWQKMNVEFSGVHGNYHGASNWGGAVFDVPSATRYMLLAGALTADGSSSEALAQWKNRGYTSVEAVQLYISANVRANASTIKLNKNGSFTSGGLEATINGTDTSATTGLVKLTGNAESLSAGDLISLALTLGTGVEDLTITFVLLTLKSTSGKSETFGLADSRAASATEHFYTIGGRNTLRTSTNVLTEAQARIKVGFAATCSNLRIYLSANTYTTDGTMTLYKNGSATAVVVTITAGGGAGWYEDTTRTVDIDDNDELSIGIVGGGANSISMSFFGLTFSPIATVVGPLVGGRLINSGALMGGRLVH